MTTPAASADSEPRWFFPDGALQAGPWRAVVDDSLPGWQYTGLKVADLGPGQALALDGGAREDLVIPLAGSFAVDYGDPDGGAPRRQSLAGRAEVFAGPSDVLYLPAGVGGRISGHGRVAVASAPTDEARPVQYLPAAGTPIELRGAGSCSRQIHNFGVVGALDAARLIVCEVITPAGNWSSYPPHKHDEDIPGVESRLEEIYYFEAAPETRGPAPEAAFGMFATYSSPSGDIAIDARVHSGDIALVPHGYHGPAVAAPGYHLYYLNVMAGPGDERAWRITDDPAYAWVRETWAAQGVDPRLPLRER